MRKVLNKMLISSDKPTLKINNNDINDNIVLASPVLVDNFDYVLSDNPYDENMTGGENMTNNENENILNNEQISDKTNNINSASYIKDNEIINEVIGKRFTKSFFNCDNSVLLEVIDDSYENKNNFIPIVEMKQDDLKMDNSLKNVNARIFQRSVFMPVDTINPLYFKIIDNEGYMKDPLNDYLKFLFGNRNIYMVNDYRGIYRYKFDVMYENDRFKTVVADYISTPLNLKYPYSKISNVKYISELTFSRAYDYLKSNEANYFKKECKKIKTNVKKNCSDNIYKIEVIPKEMMLKIAKITLYWSSIKDQFNYNDQTGYYYYYIDNDPKRAIPVICKHQAMILDGANVNDVANECYTNGICKYCGQDLIAYSEVSGYTLPPHALSLIISFSECFKNNYSAENIIYEVNEYIIKKLNYNNISIYDTNSCSGYTALFLTKMCTELKKDNILIENKVKSFLKKLSKTLAFAGKTDNDVKQILESSPMFEDITTLITKIISSKIGAENNGKNDKNYILEDVLFNSTSREPKTNLQKLYLNDRSKIFAMHIALLDLRNRLYNYNIKLENDYDEDIEEILKNISIQTNNNGYIFFTKSADIYCPVNIYHDFNSGKCKYCGLQKDLKNVYEIYEKYQTIINNSSTEKPVVINDDMLKKFSEIHTIKTEQNTINEINKISIDNFNNLLKKYVDYNTVMKLEENINKYSSNIFYEKISNVINVSLELLEKIEDKEFIKKAVLYVSKNNLQTEETIINSLLLSFIEFEDIRTYVTIKQKKDKNEEENENEQNDEKQQNITE